MKRLDELGISPTPWRIDGDNIIDAKGLDLANDYLGYVSDDARLIAAAPELYDALYDAWRRVCLSPSRNCKMCPYSGMFCNSWRAALAKASGESEVAK